MLLKDKVALVTGSTHNIGPGIARALAREGAKVVVHSRHEEDAKTVAQRIDGDYFIFNCRWRTTERYEQRQFEMN